MAEIIFDKYIDNPSLGGTSALHNRSMYKNMYKTKFDNVLAREQGTIEFTVYNDNKARDDSYYIYFKIPSEVVPQFYYDVVVQLYTTSNSLKGTNNLRKYYVKFFSNDPAFVFTFAHAFAKNDLFISDLKPKMNKESLNKVAKVRNSQDTIWYVKSLYFAYLTMEKYNLFSRATLNNICVPYNKKALLDKIIQANIKCNERQELGNQIAKEKKQGTIKKNVVNDKAVPNTKIVKTSKVSNTSKVSKIAKNVKATKVIGKRK